MLKKIVRKLNPIKKNSKKLKNINLNMKMRTYYV